MHTTFYNLYPGDGPGSQPHKNPLIYTIHLLLSLMLPSASDSGQHHNSWATNANLDGAEWVWALQNH